MSLKKEDPAEEHIFEFYIDDYASDLDLEIPSIAEEYNDIDFEEDLNDEQLDIVTNISGPMLVIAGAGSGKTRTIVYSVAKLLLTGVSPSQIMLVTFTNKAANEMIKRVEKLLGKRPKGIWAGTYFLPFPTGRFKPVTQLSFLDGIGPSKGRDDFPVLDEYRK